ncbi:hypothetical protein HEMROJRC1_19580 [Rodentibacter sp. JRC1]|nr:hypothetical protein HEMROJRC1_19580 [Rodentibacter sp. JRC1]
MCIKDNAEVICPKKLDEINQLSQGRIFYDQITDFYLENHLDVLLTKKQLQLSDITEIKAKDGSKCYVSPTLDRFKRILQENGIVQSMSRKGITLITL